MNAGHLGTIFKMAPELLCIHNYDFDCLWPHPPRSNVKQNNSNVDEEIYLSSAGAKVVHDKQRANTLGCKVLLPRLQLQCFLTSYIKRDYRGWSSGCFDRRFVAFILRYSEFPSVHHVKKGCRYVHQWQTCFLNCWFWHWCFHLMSYSGTYCLKKDRLWRNEDNSSACVMAWPWFMMSHYVSLVFNCSLTNSGYFSPSSIHKICQENNGKNTNLLYVR